MLGVSKMIGRWCSTWHYWDNCPLMIWLEETVDSLSLSNTDRWNVLDVDCCCTTSASQVNGPLLFFSNTSRGWWQVWWWSFGQQWGLIQNGRKWWKRRTRRIRKSISLLDFTMAEGGDPRLRPLWLKSKLNDILMLLGDLAGIAPPGCCI